MILKDKKSEKKRSPFAGLAAILSTLLWLVSIVLAFQISKESTWFWLPDGLLLLGFIPLLMLWRKAWLTLLFGICNTLIGFFLLILTYLESEKFVGEVLAMKEHLIHFHSPWIWMIFGVIPIFWALAEFSISSFKFFVRQIQKRREAKKENC
jgi:hypothetical protein